MLRALFAGITGLRNNQLRMDVIGNNIANINTPGFKGSRVTFEEAFIQTLQSGSGPNAMRGGTNSQQIGSGATVGNIDQLFSQGGIENTARPLDLAIQGDGFFVLSSGQRRMYTRIGAFHLDAEGRLVSPMGLPVQGITADSDGNLPAASSVDSIYVRLGEKAPPKMTEKVTLTGNLDSAADVDDSYRMSSTVYDALGESHSLELIFTKTGPGAWSWTPELDGEALDPPGGGEVTFNDDGSLADFTYPGGGSTLSMTTAEGASIDIEIIPGTVDGIDGLSGFAGSSNAVGTQDGYPAGDLLGISVDATGAVTGSFSNGVTRTLAQIVLARFSNPEGLVRSATGIYEESANSGQPTFETGGENGGSEIVAGALEGSNVDLSEEFSNMIITQRGFQASARVVTTSDEILNELVNLRR